MVLLHNPSQASRAAATLHTDPQRAGMLPFVFESGMGFERWLDYMMPV